MREARKEKEGRKVKEVRRKERKKKEAIVEKWKAIMQTIVNPDNSHLSLSLSLLPRRRRRRRKNEGKRDAVWWEQTLGAQGGASKPPSRFKKARAGRDGGNAGC